MYTNVLKALEFASRVHAGQKRKYTNEPYINHCIRVANNPLVIAAGEEAICSALMHDCIEDSDNIPATTSYIRKNFSIKILQTCVLLTRFKEESYTDYLKAIFDSPNTLASLIKYADSLDNSITHNLMTKDVLEKCHKYKLNSDKFLQNYNQFIIK